MPKKMNSDYAAAFRAAYIDHMHHDRRPSRSARYWVLGSVIAAIAVAGGSAAAVATGILPPLGADFVTTVAGATTGTFTGPADIDWAPRRQTPRTSRCHCGVCLGTLVFPDGASVHCSAGDQSGYTPTAPISTTPQTTPPPQTMQPGTTSKLGTSPSTSRTAPRRSATSSRRQEPPGSRSAILWTTGWCRLTAPTRAGRVET